MLATGNSLIEAVKIYTEKNIPIKNIKIVSIISAPEGIANIQKQFPEIQITTAAIDFSPERTRIHRSGNGRCWR